MVFRKHKEFSSIRQLFNWFHEEGIELPVNQFTCMGRGERRIGWQLPTLAFLSSLLHKPFYGGAYAYGRRVVEVICRDGEIMKKTGRFLPMAQWKVLIKDHHECYIRWAEYEENLKQIRRNSLTITGDEKVGAIRAGQGILAGLLRCGRCGRKLHVRYWGKSGTAARYLCKGDFDSGGFYCIGFGGAGVDRRFGKELMRVLTPLTFEASLKGIEELERERDEKKNLLEKQLQQLEYEARRTYEQYNEVDPRNRLVAFNLERRWNEKLEEVQALKEQISDVAPVRERLSAEEREKIFSLGERFEEIWEGEGCPAELKKKLIRSIVEEIIVNLDEEKDRLRFIIHWKGGTHTHFEMEKPKSAIGKKTSLEDLDVIRKMAPRYGDDEIARVLSKLGRRTAKGNRWSVSRVKTIRLNNNMKRTGRIRRDEEILTQGEAARYCGVSTNVIRRLAHLGLLKYEQIVSFASWEIRKEHLDKEPIRSVIDELKKRGKLDLKGIGSSDQPALL